MRPTDDELRTLADRLAIEGVLDTYAAALDRRDWDLLEEVFTSDAILDYQSAGGPRGGLPEVSAWLQEVLAGFAMSQHLVTNRRIVVDGDEATSTAYFYNPMGLADGEGGMTLMFFGGYYHDRHRRTAHGWRICERVEESAWADMTGRPSTRLT